MTRFTSSRTVERSFVPPMPRRAHIRQAMTSRDFVPMYSRIPWSKLITGAVMAPCVIYAVSLWIKP